MLFMNNEKISCIAPILHENKLIIDLKQKAEKFSYFFACQFTPAGNNSKLLLELEKKT